MQRFVHVPAGRFLRMKRAVNLRVRESDGHGVMLIERAPRSYLAILPRS